MRLYFAKPSLRRLIWSTVGAMAACSVIVSTAYVIGALVTSADDPIPTSTGEYVLLSVIFLTFWGPILMLNFWYLSLPVVISLGVLASIRRRAVPTGT